MIGFFQDSFWMDGIRKNLDIASQQHAPINDDTIQVGDDMVYNYLKTRSNSMLRNKVYYNVESFCALMHYHFENVRPGICFTPRIAKHHPSQADTSLTDDVFGMLVTYVVRCFLLFTLNRVYSKCATQETPNMVALHDALHSTTRVRFEASLFYVMLLSPLFLFCDMKLDANQLSASDVLAVSSVHPRAKYITPSIICSSYSCKANDSAHVYSNNSNTPSCVY